MDPRLGPNSPLPKAAVSFGGATGSIAVHKRTAVPVTYPYTPFRSGAHYRLALALREHGTAEVEVDFGDGRVPMVVTAITADTITLAPKPENPPA